MSMWTGASGWEGDGSGGGMTYLRGSQNKLFFLNDPYYNLGWGTETVCIFKNQYAIILELKMFLFT